MTKQVPNLTERQLKTLEVLHRIQSAKITLGVVLGAFIVVLVSLLVTAFCDVGGPYLKWAFATIDGLLGVCLHQVVRHLFPTGKSSAK
jgi:hypothetical protein